MVDPRLIPDATIETLATRLMPKTDCARQFGLMFATKRFPGVVVEVVHRHNVEKLVYDNDCSRLRLRYSAIFVVRRYH